MNRSPFVAARHSRHRTAALALYRALIRSATRVPLPRDVYRGEGRNGPLVQLTRRCFARNRAYTSLRLLYAAMTEGYKFLTFFAQAQTPDSHQHAQVTSHLRCHLGTLAAGRLASESRPRKPPLESPATPLLTKISAPNAPPEYVSTLFPRPKDSVQGGRRIPSLCATALGQPFLRIKKPQSPKLSKMVGRKGLIFSGRIDKIVEIDDGLSEEARLEDQWDSLVERQIRKDVPGARENAGDPEFTFSWTVQVSRLWCELQIEKNWQDWVARGSALHRVVEGERALVRHEKGESIAAEPPGNVCNHGKGRAYRGMPPQANLAEYPTPFPLASVFHDMSGKSSWVQNREDPFISPAWSALLKKQRAKLLRWANTGSRYSDR